MAEVAGSRRKRTWIYALAILVALFGTCVSGGVWLVARNWAAICQAFREYDGYRPLINGYKLWMLHAFPREIMYGDSSSPGDATVPSNSIMETHEVGRYAIVGDVILGEIVPFSNGTPPPSPPPGWPVPAPGTPPPTHFILDTGAHKLTEYSSRAPWVDALKARGIDADGLKMRR